MNPVDLDSRLGGAPAAAPARPAAGTGPSFGQVLRGHVQDQLAAQLTAQAARANVKFSGHAQARLQSRQIALSGDDIARLGEAMTRAAQKGARSSLVLTDTAALVVSVPNRTVITAVDKAAMKENLFTNIDSAMIL